MTAPPTSTWLAGGSEPGRGVFETRPWRRSSQIETIQVHHLGPSRHEVTDELLLRIGATINFGERPELSVGAEDEIDARAGPFQLTGFTVTSFEHVLGVRHRFPLRTHV